MGKQIDEVSSELHRYMVAHGSSLDPSQRWLIKQTQHVDGAHMAISEEVGQLLGSLVASVGVKRSIDVGTFCGYSALSLALAAEPDGLVTTCDISDANLGLAAEAWERGGVKGRIKVKTGPAIATLDELVTNNTGSTPFDLAFIDADKAGYLKYFQLCDQLVRPGGVIVLDDTLWMGKIVDGACGDRQVKPLRELNEHLASNSNYSVTMLPIGNGVTVAAKKRPN